MAVILLMCLRLGYGSGQRLAEAEVVALNARAVAGGLEFFYNDNARFPTAAEFADTKVMGTYLTGFPPVGFVSGTCDQSYQYRRLRAGSHELYFCLPKGIEGFRQGWNTIESSH